MLFKAKNRFLLLCFLYALIVSIGLLILSILWLPPGYALVGHDSGLALGSKNFLLSRLHAWDERLGFGFDNSVAFGSITIHFFDWLLAMIGGTPYAGNFVSLFFWLGLIFLSGFALSYQFKDKFGKPFVFILPVFLVFNFYIFQSVFILERAKYGIFAATLLSLTFFFRMKAKKLSLIPSTILSALVFTVFNGGSWFGITYYGGVALILIVLIFASLAKGLLDKDFYDFKATLKYVFLSCIFYLLFNLYSILPYLKNFLESDSPVLLRDSVIESNKEWLRYISRAASFLNIFKLAGIPEWYEGPGDANLLHPYAALYLNKGVLAALGFVFPILAFSSFLLVKKQKQKEILSIFGLIALVGAVFTAGSHSPTGFFYEFLMDVIPGFAIFRSAFYKFSIFYMLGMLVLFAFTVSFLIEKVSGGKKVLLSLFTILTLFGWLGYHWVLFDSKNVFTWQTGQSTKVKVPSYIYDFQDWIEKNDLSDKRTLLLPPFNRSWKADAYDWGYWSLYPLPSMLASARFLSNWDALTDAEISWIERLYDAIGKGDESGFTRLANWLDVGHILLRNDVLDDRSWSSAEAPEAYAKVLDSSGNVQKISTFERWDLYQLEAVPANAVFTVSSLNIVPDEHPSLAYDFFPDGHTVSVSEAKKYKELNALIGEEVKVVHCLSCLIEKQAAFSSFPVVRLLPNSPLYYLKERREQKILGEEKGPKSKVNDYLGLVLRRAAELKSMIDLSIGEEEDFLSTMQTTRSYLEQVLFHLQLIEGASSDFEILRRVLDLVDPFELELLNYTQLDRFSRDYSPAFKEEAKGLLWSISEIKKFFSPTLQDLKQWSTKKIYKVNFPKDGRYALFFLPLFPLDLEGKSILPLKVELIRAGQAEQLKLMKEGDGWLPVELGYQNAGDVELVLYFDKLPNLFSIEGSGFEEFFFGKAACYNGRIKNFDKSRGYEILVSKTELNPAKIILRDKNRIYSPKHKFLEGEGTFEVPVVAKGEFARDVYTPSSLAKDIFIYICSDNTQLPNIEEIVVQELFAPIVVNMKKDSSVNVLTKPKVEYTRISPTNYEVEIEPTDTPFIPMEQTSFILVFNERFNPSWKLIVEDGDGDKKIIDNHFIVDGYANAWLVSGIDRKKLTIGYEPQFFFYVGGIVSGTALLTSLSWLTLSMISKRKRKENKL